jgi:hypothetical protein
MELEVSAVTCYLREWQLLRRLPGGRQLSGVSLQFGPAITTSHAYMNLIKNYSLTGIGTGTHDVLVLCGFAQIPRL